MRAIASLSFVALVFVACSPARPQVKPKPMPTGCPPEMARVELDGSTVRAFCIDRWEASLVEITDQGEREASPFEQIGKRKVRAVSKEGVMPQAYVSRDEAEVACKRSEKRLCTEREWTAACMGNAGTTYPYGKELEAGACNDKGNAPLVRLASQLAGDEWARMNDPRLNQVSGSLAKTGSFARCKSAFGVFDMVGNLHEWVDDREGTFMGGYYLDTKLNGPGCRYKTVAHGASYHDYSTGFRCCSGLREP